MRHGPEGAKADEGSPARGTHLNVRHLEVFWATMRSGNQHEAARMLGLSQPAISKVLRYTEERIGVPLFRRIKGRLQPTAEAQVFFRAVDDIFGRLESAERLARDLQRKLSGRISLTTIAAFTAVLVPEALEGFLHAHALVKAGLKVLPPAQVVERVANGEADLGLTFGPVEHTTLDAQVLCTVPIVCAVPAGHRLAGRPSLTANDLDGERLITATERPLWGKMVEDAFTTAGARAEVAVECTQSDLAFAMAERAAGIAVVPAVPLRPDQALGVAMRLFRPAIPVPVVAVTHAGRPVPHAVEALVTHLREAAARVNWGVLPSRA